MLELAGLLAKDLIMNRKLKIYFSKKMLITIAFGFSSGLPLALVFGTLSLWLKDYNIAYKTIGAFSLLRLPYSFKWLWAPMVETLKIPVLSKLGKRRSWAIFAQIGLLLSIVWLSLLKPDEGILYMALAALFVSFFSATQDIVLDAFRVEIFAGKHISEVKGATMYVLGWRFGSIVSSAGAIGMAAVVSWNVVYFVNALCVILGIIAVMLAKEPSEKRSEKREIKNNVWQYALVSPFKQFMQKPYWVVCLCIIFSYRLSDAYFGPLAYPFYADIGFTKVEIAYVSKLYGMVATIIGGLLGGYVIGRIGLLKGLLIFGLLQGVTTAFYIPLYYIGHNVWFLMATISLENLCSGMATTAIIAFMSILCNQGYTATQYALLSSLPGFARDVFASTSGHVLEATSWPLFFGVSSLLALPAIVLCWYLYKKNPDYLINT